MSGVELDREGKGRGGRKECETLARWKKWAGVACDHDDGEPCCVGAKPF